MSILSQKDIDDVLDEIGYYANQRAIELVEKKLLAKLASAELPEPEVFDGSYLKNGEWKFEDGYTADQLRQAYAQGAAAQLAETPSAFLDIEMDCAYTLQELGGDPVREFPPLYTRKEAK